MRRRTLGLRALLGAASVLALILIAIPLASTIALRSSQAASAKGQLSQALAYANTAQAIEPGAASPYLQRALVFEQANEIGHASKQITVAIAHEPDNYQLWLIALRIATEANHPHQALVDYRHVMALYPTTTVFSG